MSEETMGAPEKEPLENEENAGIVGDTNESASERDSSNGGGESVATGEAVVNEAVPDEAAIVEPSRAEPSEADALRDRLLRLQADFDNYRKRVARDRADLVAQAGADVLEAMLPPMDHLELAIDTMAKTAPADDPFLKGVRMVRDEMLAAFARFSLEPIPTEVGAELDPNAEEALGIVPVPGIPENRIAIVVRKGYALHGRVLRPAQVMVGAGAPAEATQDAAAEDK